VGVGRFAPLLPPPERISKARKPFVLYLLSAAYWHGRASVNTHNNGYTYQIEHQKQVIQSIQQYTGGQLTPRQASQWGTHI